MTSRDVRKVTYLSEEEAAQLSEWAAEAGKSESTLLREAILEYLDHDRTARIEEKVDELLDRIPEEGAPPSQASGAHTHRPDPGMNQSGSTATERAREIIRRLRSNADNPDGVVDDDTVTMAIEDIAGVDDRTIRKYKTLFRKRGLLFEHPGEARPIWTFDSDQWLTWMEDFARLNGQEAAEDVADGYPANVHGSNQGISIELAEVDGDV